MRIILGFLSVISIALTTIYPARISSAATAPVKVSKAPEMPKIVQTVYNPVSPVPLLKAAHVQPQTPSQPTLPTDHQQLALAAGIVSADFQYADYIMSHESGWQPTAVNPRSGAYGECQSLPASKMAETGSDWQTNPLTQLRWCNGYAKLRYGGWYNAYLFWQANGWW